MTRVLHAQAEMSRVTQEFTRAAPELAVPERAAIISMHRGGKGLPRRSAGNP